MKIIKFPLWTQSGNPQGGTVAKYITLSFRKTNFKKSFYFIFHKSQREEKNSLNVKKRIPQTSSTLFLIGPHTEVDRFSTHRIKKIAESFHPPLIVPSVPHQLPWQANFLKKSPQFSKFLPHQNCQVPMWGKSLVGLWETLVGETMSEL